MVTLRRDIAALTKNKSLNGKELTAYDLFMEKKSKKSQDNYVHSMENAACAPDYFSSPYIDNNKGEALTSYDRYMLKQLNRSSPDIILEKEEFYKKNVQVDDFSVQKEAKIPTAAIRAKSKLTKNVKIFITVYVLVVAIIASIILAVNRDSGPRADAKSVDEGAVTEISSLDIEGEETPTNWFDKLLDGISNA